MQEKHDPLNYWPETTVVTLVVVVEFVVFVEFDAYKLIVYRSLAKIYYALRGVQTKNSKVIKMVIENLSISF